MLWDLMETIYKQEEMSMEWRDNVIVLIVGPTSNIVNKDAVMCYGVWERVIDRRLRGKQLSERNTSV